MSSEKLLGSLTFLPPTAKSNLQVTEVGADLIIEVTPGDWQIARNAATYSAGIIPGYVDIIKRGLEQHGYQAQTVAQSTALFKPDAQGIQAGDAGVKVIGASIVMHEAKEIAQLAQTNSSTTQLSTSVDASNQLIAAPQTASAVSELVASVTVNNRRPVHLWNHLVPRIRLIGLAVVRKDPVPQIDNQDQLV